MATQMLRTSSILYPSASAIETTPTKVTWKTA